MRLFTFPSKFLFWASCAFLLVLCSRGNVQAQQPVPLWCGTLAPTPAQLAVQQQLDATAMARPLAGAVTYVPVCVYIVRRSDGTGGAYEPDLYQSLAETNSIFAQANIQFYLCGAPRYIDNSAWYDYKFKDESNLSGAPNYNDGALNLYYPYTIDLAPGYTYVNPGPSSRKVFLSAPRKGYGPPTHLLAHELGHVLGLLHTESGNDDDVIANRELVARTNCTTTGDLLCDTPADPRGLPGATFTNTWTYTGTVTDAQGARFTPMMFNAMGGWGRGGNEFTPGQYARMQTSRQTYQADLRCAQSMPAAPTNLKASSTGCVGGAQLVWSNPSGSAAVGYFVERAVAGGNFATVGTVEAGVSTYRDDGAPSNTSLQYRVKPINAESSFSNVVDVKSGKYCPAPYLSTTTYTTSSFPPLGLGPIILHSGPTRLLSTKPTGGGPSYAAFPTQQIRLLPGKTYTLYVNMFFNAGGSYPQYLSVWLDINQNGTFTDPGEQLLQGKEASTFFTVPFSVPPGTPNGCGALRVRTQDSYNGPVLDACAPLSSGETQDYPVLFGTATASFAQAPEAAPPMTIVPNPATKQARVSLPVPSRHPGMLQVCDVLGREVRRYNLPVGSTQLTLELAGLRPGLYLVRVGSGTTRLVVE